MLVGEQPGDQEDLKGAPFVGPAGEVLDRALAEVGIDRQQRLRHQRGEALQLRAPRQAAHPPDAARAGAGRLPAVARGRAGHHPACRARGLGATAARALFGPEFRLLRQHGQFMATRWSPKSIATLHPSAVLRGQDDAEQARLYAMLRDDLRLIAAAYAARTPRHSDDPARPGARRRSARRP